LPLLGRRGAESQELKPTNKQSVENVLEENSKTKDSKRLLQLRNAETIRKLQKNVNRMLTLEKILLVS